MTSARQAFLWQCYDYLAVLKLPQESWFCLTEQMGRHCLGLCNIPQVLPHKIANFVVCRVNGTTISQHAELMISVGQTFCSAALLTRRIECVDYMLMLARQLRRRTEWYMHFYHPTGPKLIKFLSSLYDNQTQDFPSFKDILQSKQAYNHVLSNMTRFVISIISNFTSAQHSIVLADTAYAGKSPLQTYFRQGDWWKVSICLPQSF